MDGAITAQKTFKFYGQFKLSDPKNGLEGIIDFLEIAKKPGKITSLFKKSVAPTPYQLN